MYIAPKSLEISKTNQNGKSENWPSTNQKPKVRLSSSSENWLGRWAYSEKVRRSGTWNSEYVDDPYEMTITDLEEMERNVKKLRTPSAT